MATGQCSVATEFVQKVKNEGKHVNENQNCCLKIEINIQSLLNEVKTLNEILNILSEEWRQCKVTEEVRNDEQHADKIKAKEKHLISCNCDTLKTQCLELQKEINLLSSRVKSTKKGYRKHKAGK